ncbi:unnamed protein product [Prorocentrum cordatum]|uniref:Uncharacterized protein n=1 Tax=Prorocentrum cordatum TaxID=2364126 RepID=A0ABN9WME9_9DINO|nr:unnamed protein product [Polarella glacialis]
MQEAAPQLLGGPPVSAVPLPPPRWAAPAGFAETTPPSEASTPSLQGSSRSLPLGKIIATHHSQASRGSRVSAIQAALGGLRGRASKVLLPRPGLARGAPGDAALGARP